jgi:hypothetical protein
MASKAADSEQERLLCALTCVVIVIDASTVPEIFELQQKP